MIKKVLAVLAASLLFAAPVWAASKTYQVTGPVLELSADKIVVEKGKARWELARDTNTKIPAAIQVGSKVTIEYTMTAVTVEAKVGKDKKKGGKAKK